MRSSQQHPEDVKARVRKTGVSLAELARRASVTPGTVNQSLYRPIPAGNRVIADHLGVPVQRIWPEWYDEEGNRRRDSGWTSITRTRAPQRQKRGCA